MKQLRKKSKHNIKNCLELLLQVKKLIYLNLKNLKRKNQPTPIFLGTEKISEHFDNALLFVDVNRVKRGFIEIEFVVLAESVKGMKEYEITELHTRHLEKRIIENPAYWLWSHKRWKHKPNDAIKEKFNLS